MARRSIPVSDVGEPAAFVPAAPSKAARDRSWEAAQRSGDFVQISYRRMPRALREAIREIAERHLVTVDEVARVFLEYAVSAHQAGVLKLEPKLQRGKYSLFGGEGNE